MFKLSEEQIKQIDHLLKKNKDIIIRKTKDGFKILTYDYKKIFEEFDN